MMTFSAEKGFCPRYKDFYIKDRAAGTDVHGHDRYEYALFRMLPWEEAKDGKKMALYEKARKIITEGSEEACQECKKKGTPRCAMESCTRLREWTAAVESKERQERKRNHESE